MYAVTQAWNFRRRFIGSVDSVWNSHIHLVYTHNIHKVYITHFYPTTILCIWSNAVLWWWCCCCQCCCGCCCWDLVLQVRFFFVRVDDTKWFWVVFLPAIRFGFVLRSATMIFISDECVCMCVCVYVVRFCALCPAHPVENRKKTTRLHWSNTKARKIIRIYTLDELTQTINSHFPTLFLTEIWNECTHKHKSLFMLWAWIL